MCKEEDGIFNGHLGCFLVIGYIRKENLNIYNSAAVCYDGQIQSTYDKVLLPTYDVFDEARYFTPGDKPCVASIKKDSKIYKIL